MIRVEKKIVVVNYTLSGNTSFRDIQEKQVNGIYLNAQIPLIFNYLSNWNIEHNCTCGESVTFGEDDSLGAIFTLMENLCSKYYDIDILKSFSKLFNKAVLKEIKGEQYLVIEEDFDENFPITTSITLIYYSCKNCQNEFLVRFRRGYPYEPDYERQEGMIGKIFIDEIVQIDGDTPLFEMFRRASRSIDKKDF